MSDQGPEGQPQPEQQPPAYGYPQQPPPGQPGYPQQPPPGYPQQGFPAPGYGLPLLPKQPQAQTAMILGIIALAGMFACVLPILLSPFAWYYGVKAKREIDAEPGRWAGRSEAQAGFVMGIIGTVLIVLGVLAIIAIAALAIAFSETSTSTGY